MLGASASEKEGVELLFAEDTANLDEGEEGKEGAEDEDRPTYQLIRVDIVDDRSGGLPVNQAFDELLEEVEGEHEQAK